MFVFAIRHAHGGRAKRNVREFHRRTSRRGEGVKQLLGLQQTHLRMREIAFVISIVLCPGGAELIGRDDQWRE